MSMHLVGPWLTTTGKKKGKKKWRSAEHKRKAEEYEQGFAAMRSGESGKVILNWD